MKIDGYTRMAAVIAHPIRHSISPFIHNLAYELTATNAAYLAWDIAEEDLESTISQIRKLDMIGANISMPYKQKVFPYLDEVDEMARKIGSVNTIVHRDGKLKGYNTDGIGFFRSLPPAFSIKGKNNGSLRCRWCSFSDYCTGDSSRCETYPCLCERGKIGSLSFNSSVG